MEGKMVLAWSSWIWKETRKTIDKEPETKACPTIPLVFWEINNVEKQIRIQNHGKYNEHTRNQSLTHRSWSTPTSHSKTSRRWLTTYGGQRLVLSPSQFSLWRAHQGEISLWWGMRLHHRLSDGACRRKCQMKFDFISAATVAAVALLTWVVIGSEMRSSTLNDPTIQGAVQIEQLNKYNAWAMKDLIKGLGC